ncbi:MAG: HAD family hydrolase [Desulfofustis sp.]|nr:HAD family hydrolase [Desulfofustis sp.]NNK58316.1 HAD family hydrolase [Desulfofustis sp.]
MTTIHHRFKTIIFDLDGTLIDSLNDIAKAANAVLAELGFPLHPKNSYLNFVGDGLLTLAARMVPEETSGTQVKAVAARFRTVYKDCWSDNSRPYPGILTMLEALDQLPVNLAVLSNKPDDFTQLFVNRFFPAKMFGQVMGNRPGVPKKPDPTAALAIANFFGCENADCLMVGDSGVDMKTGKNGGMSSLGVSWGFRSRQELIESGADLLIDHPSELISHVIDH